MRRHPQETEAPGHDSFLDIVANIVGILIILVMVTGLRAKHWPADARQEEAVPAVAVGLEKDQAAEAGLRRELATISDQLRQLDMESLTQNQVRMQLATAAAAVEHEIESRRSRLDAQSQDAFRLRQQLAQAQSALDRLRHEKQMALATESAPTRIESYPTPLSETVEGEELHFKLEGGRVAYIPLERLLARFKQEAQRKIYKLRDLPEMTDTVGPEGGFRLRYTMVRRDPSPNTQYAGAGGSYAELVEWTLIPTGGPLGEPADAALAEGSRFREVLLAYPPNTTTVTIWTYPDSFAEFRRIKKALYKMGYSAAARPLPEGTPIGGSPEGTKSAAQ